MPPTDLSRCDYIPILKLEISVLDQHISDSDPGRRDQLLSPESRADDALKFEELAIELDILDRRRKQAVQEGDSEKLRDLDRRLAELDREIAKLSNREHLRREPPTPQERGTWRRQRQVYQRELDELIKFCSKFVTENDEPTSSDKENISATNSQRALEGRLQAELARVGDAPDETLLKPVAAVTRREIGRLMTDPDFGRPTDRGRALSDKTQAWFDHVWGKWPAARDDTGKLVEGTPVNPPPDKPTPLRGADGRPVDQTLRAIGADLDKLVADPDAPEDEAEAVRALQRAVNLAPRLARSPTAPRRAAASGTSDGAIPPHADLRVDGLLGDQTRAQTRLAAMRIGYDKLKEGLALGRFQGFAERAGPGASSAPRTLMREIDVGFGPLFEARHPTRWVGHRTSAPVVAALQDALNDLGQGPQARDFAALETDGLVGPKTATAFGDAIRRDGAGAVTSAFGHRLGFLDDDADVAVAPDLGFGLSGHSFV